MPKAHGSSNTRPRSAVRTGGGAAVVVIGLLRFAWQVTSGLGKLEHVVEGCTAAFHIGKPE
eukprot:CAMPEP_0119110802 /NCGR_PEP_ID=MMETSP1180-20130426/32109_1 /TAXON_ID=3052 ORGANISM="Chlamydomonas cf sp, Strain CCMP681" /NCGR_SAMPLE_ID=MMETSP1180 /ASSEMBLY_ACC=CAM_ASM_000741 /LENGTH=60 /DNA_ID=CAMNT_0007097381 /DNA_START=743 /DNA_END=925 /DNA_ORIENTATION=+